MQWKFVRCDIPHGARANATQRQKPSRAIRRQTEVYDIYTRERGVKTRDTGPKSYAYARLWRAVCER